MSFSVPFLCLTASDEKDDLSLITVQDEVKALANLTGSRAMSCFNALCQIFFNLEEITFSLPVYHQDGLVTLFTSLVYEMHMGRLPAKPVTSGKWETVIQGLKQSAESDGMGMKCAVGPVGFLKDGNDASIPDLLSSTYNALVSDILLKTRFEEHLLKTSRSETHPGCIPFELESLSLSKYSVLELNSLISAQFTSRPLPTLPSCLVFYIDRKSAKDGLVSNRLQFQMILEMEKFVDPGYIHFKLPYGIGKSKRSTTFELHGFVTQKDGVFMTYSRYSIAHVSFQNGKQWFLIHDGRVDQVSLANDIESAGVTILLYRLIGSSGKH